MNLIQKAKKTSWMQTSWMHLTPDAKHHGCICHKAVRFLVCEPCILMLSSQGTSRPKVLKRAKQYGKLHKDVSDWRFLLRKV